MGEQYQRKPNISCQICGKKIYRRPIEIKKHNGRAFCSLECYGKSCRKEKPCLVCGKLILAALNKKTCSRSCANKHREGIKYTGRSPKDKVKTQRILKDRLFEVRGKKCERCGFEKCEILEIHHKDKNRNNNNFDNLEIVCPNCHSLEHFTENKNRRFQNGEVPKRS